MPLLQMSVLELQKSLFPTGLEEAAIATLMYDILQALSYLHSSNQIHRDLKLSNFLLSEEGSSLLSDFGVASATKPFSSQVHSTFVGSPLYMAPEVANNSTYNQSCDVWGFGMCLL